MNYLITITQQINILAFITNNTDINYLPDCTEEASLLFAECSPEDCRVVSTPATTDEIVLTSKFLPVKVAILFQILNKSVPSFLSGGLQ